MHYLEGVGVKKFTALGLLFPLLILVCRCKAQEFPEMRAPQKEHQWLNQLAGEWDTATLGFGGSTASQLRLPLPPVHF
jgi:hypothetical protein